MNNLERIRTARGMTQETLALSAGKTNVVKGGFEKNRLDSVYTSLTEVV